MDVGSACANFHCVKPVYPSDGIADPGPHPTIDTRVFAQDNSTYWRLGEWSQAENVDRRRECNFRQGSGEIARGKVEARTDEICIVLPGDFFK